MMRICLFLIVSVAFLQQVAPEDVLYFSPESLPPIYDEPEIELYLPEEDDDTYVGSRKVMSLDNDVESDFFLSLDELDEFEDTLTIFDNHETHTGGYDPLFVNLTNSRVRRSNNAFDQFKQKTKELLQQVIKKLKDAQKIKTPDVIRHNTREALQLMDKYYQTVRDEQVHAREDDLQIIKSDDDIILLANCGGIWYPIKDTLKVLRCEKGSLKFQERFHQTISICDDYICEKSYV